MHGLGTEILIAVIVAFDVYDKNGYGCVITEGSGAKHGYSSEHYKGDAVDLRTRHVANDKMKEIARVIAKNLGKDYDVVLEETHLHIEYDPK